MNSRRLCHLYLSVLLLALAPPAFAVDGPLPASTSMSGPTSPTYFEAMGAKEAEIGAATLPTTVHVSDSDATVTYTSVETPDGELRWTARIRDFARNHERVEGVYQLILVLPLPRWDVRVSSRGIALREGSEQASVPLIYGGEKVVLKRNRMLEATLLPSLLGPLPDLAGTGYHYTLWDTILLYDSRFGDVVQGFAELTYTTGPEAVAPDPNDERQKAYVLVSIPGLDPTIPPFAIRMDVVGSED